MCDTEQTMLESAQVPVLDDWLNRVRAEYLEVPGLRLTKPQVQRFWGLDSATTDALLGALQDANFLRRTRDDMYVRADTH
jgi:hypothetical protein